MAPASKSPLWEILLRATVPLALLSGGALVAHEIRLSTIEETRFTDRDGSTLTTEIIEWVEDRYPRTDLIQAHLQRIEAKVDALSEEIRK